MALPNSSDILKRATNNFNSIKNGMEYIGIDTSLVTSDTYGDLIKALKPELDSIPVLKAEVEKLTDENTNLNTQVSEDDTDFLNIYDAIVAKGQTPVKNNRDTYAPSIMEIASGGVELTIMDYFFYNNCRSVDTYWNMVTNKVESMINMLNGAHFTGGNTYDLDLRGIIDNTKINSIVSTSFSIDGTGNITLNFKFGKNINTLQGVLNGNSLSGSTTNGINITFDESVDASNLTSLRNAFAYKYISNIDFSNLGNAPITSLRNMLGYSYLINNIDFSNLDTSLVTDFSYCFQGLKNKDITLDLSKWSFASATDVTYMFNDTQASEIILPEGIEFNNISTHYLFCGAPNITHMALDIVNTNNVSNYWTFKDLASLVTVSSTKQWILSSNSRSIFYQCRKLVSVPSIKYILHTYGYSSSDLSNMFYNCNSLKDVDVTIEFMDGYGINCDSMFRYCTVLEHITCDLNLSYVTNVNNMFGGCTSLIDIETVGSFGGNSTTSSLTLDLSASAVFNIEAFINSLASNDSGYTRTIKLNSTVYSGMTDETIALAVEKNYTLASA